MAKIEIVFTCSNCEAQYKKWAGRCLECGKWGTISEQGTVISEQKIDVPKASPIKTVAFSELKGKEIERSKTNISELDRVLGGGIVPGSLILLGGEPGIGKSTLSIQLATVIPNTLYISGEESIDQIKLRADRLGINAPDLRLANETNVDTICATIKQLSPALVVVDSIQTMYSENASGEVGSMTQVRASTATLLESAKSSKTAIIIIGHVTKEGTVAGPKTLEHLVDTVLYLEGRKHNQYRILRTVKNRFGSTDEVGIFEMQETGLKEVKNPSASFLDEGSESTPGTIITCLMEGTRPMLVEIQALVTKTSFGFPIRKSSGFDLNRLHVLTAVLQKRANLNLAQYDIHLNVAGGIRASEPAVDLAVCLAIASSYKDKALGKDLIVFGEVGLGGEVRSVSFTERRLKEAEGLGMRRGIIAANKKMKLPTTSIKIFSVKNIEELIKHS